MSTAQLKIRIRALLFFFMLALAFSGLTAIPLEWGINLLVKWFGAGTRMASLWPAMSHWLVIVQEAILATAQNYPFMFYGTDWLAFGHVVIALAFIGPLRDPVKNIWVVELGMLACLLVIPWGMIFALWRGIPLFWLPIDFSFGVFGIIPLWLARRYILELKKTKTMLATYK
jgi:hypothetical protein